METMEDIRNQPQNIVRKMGAIQHCKLELERFRMKYRPIFEDDPDIMMLLEILDTDYQKLLLTLRNHPDYMQHFYNYWKE